jgi:hypothetical protein
MKAWETFVELLVASFPDAVIESESAARCVLLVGSVRIGVRLRHTVAYDKTVIVMTAGLGNVGRIDAYEGLALNAVLASGAIALDGERLELRAIFPTTTDVRDLLAGLQLLAREAATIKPTPRSRVAVSEAFSCFAD